MTNTQTKNINLRDFLNSKYNNDKYSKIENTLNTLIVSAIKVYGRLNHYNLNVFPQEKTVCNSSGDIVSELDILCDNIIFGELQNCRDIGGIISEERKDINIFRHYSDAEFIIAYDPLDGSMNGDFNITTASIFSIYPIIDKKNIETNFFQSGKEQYGAVYFIYSAALIMVFSFGDGVYEFTYDRNAQEFLLTYDRQAIPQKGYIYSCNEAYTGEWGEGYRQYLLRIKDANNKPRYLSRYLAAVVGDIHRIIHKGGIYIYPLTHKDPNGKIRLCYEANPLAYILEQSGGAAVTGTSTVLETPVKDIHQKTPFIAGSPENIRELKELYVHHNQ